MNRRDLFRLSIPAVAVGTGLLPVIAHAETFTLTPRESEQVVTGILDPPLPSDALVEAAKWYAHGKWSADQKFGEVLAVLRSNEFRCVAHESMEQTYIRYDDPRWIARPNRHYDGAGYCKLMLTASVQHEYGDMGSKISSALIFDGPCAVFHGYTDDSQEYHDLSERYSERKALLKQVMGLLYP